MLYQILTERRQKQSGRSINEYYTTNSGTEVILAMTLIVQDVTSSLLTNATLNAAFPNLAHLASFHLVLPVTTATVEKKL